MPTKYKCSLCSSFLPSTHQPCSLVSFSHGLSAMVQCFSLTTNQYQPGLSAQKPTNEQADHHFFWFSIYFLSITCSDYFLPVTEKQFTHFRRREVLLCCFIGSDQEQQLSSLHVDRHLVLMVNVFDPAYITREKWPKNGRLCRFVI